jgi:hypothetical protein
MPGPDIGQPEPEEVREARRMIAVLEARGELDERHPAVVMARVAVARWEVRQK